MTEEDILSKEDCHETIHRICEKYLINNYTINEDLSIDVDGNVNLYSSGFEELPLNFRYVSGYFRCDYNYLTSLKGSPIECEIFYCDYNKLTTLDSAPKKCVVFYCACNPLKDLTGIPLNISEKNLHLPDEFNYNDYKAYKRDLKFKRILCKQ